MKRPVLFSHWGVLFNVIILYFLNVQRIDGQVKLLSPSALVSRAVASLGSDVLTGATATFGAPTYGESFVALLVYVPSASNYCHDDYGKAVSSVIHPPNGGLVSDHIRHVFLVHRGNCTFVKKVAVAQALGADAVLFADSPDSPWTRDQIHQSVILGDDGNGRSVRIPSVMLAKEDASVLVDFLRTSTPPTDKNSASTVALVQLQWSLPQDSVVSLDFWMEAGSAAAVRFIREYAYHALALRHHLRFTPHYNIFSLLPTITPYAAKLSSQVPDESEKPEPSSAVEPSVMNQTLCWPDDLSLCTNPSDIPSSPATGLDVLEETVRQLCLWETTVVLDPDAPTGTWASEEWWEYIRRFYDVCSAAPNHPSLSSSQGATAFGASCSYAVMQLVPGIDVHKVQECARSRAKELLIRERNHRAWGNLAVRINGAKFSGSLDPVLVSRAVCTAFDTPPSACERLVSFGGLLPKSSADILGDPGHTRRASSYVMTIAAFGGVFCAAIFCYQKVFHKSVRALLRHEVMLEVRSQMRQYQRIEDFPSPQKELEVPLAGYLQPARNDQQPA